ncbi:MAG: hypothetical protein HPY69_01495 [Armatimonadetes bacterium]|nr:hypothetical protein [Armatimonadota bacterium]
MSAQRDAVQINHQPAQRIEDSRSFFIAAPCRLGDDEHPFWGTVGFGNRGGKDYLLAGLSYQPSPRLKVRAEYDGWNVNAAAAYDMNGGGDEGK